MTKRKYPRISTDFPGVVYRETEAGKVFYIRYRREGDRQLIEDRLTGRGWTPARAAGERNRRIEGKDSNSEIKEQLKVRLETEKALKEAEQSRPTLQF